MIGIDQAKQTIGIMLHPEKATAASKGIREAVVWYYKLSVVPLIITIILAAIVGGAVITLPSVLGSPAAQLSGLGYAAALGAAGIVLLYFIVLIPVGLLVGAGLLHFFGKYVFRKFKEDYAHTLTATVYQTAPAVLFFWLFVIPLLGTVANIVIGIWSLVVYIFALSNLQKISKWAVVGISVGMGIIVFIVALIIGGALALGAL